MYTYRGFDINIRNYQGHVAKKDKNKNIEIDN